MPKFAENRRLYGTSSRVTIKDKDSASPFQGAVAIAKAKKVKHNPSAPSPSLRIVFINGIPYIKRNGGLVAMAPVVKK
jgi:hypothetical protein